MTKLTTVFGGDLNSIKPATEDKKDAATVNKGRFEAMRLLCGYIRVSEGLEELYGASRLWIVGTERCANALYGLDFGLAQIHIESWHLNEGDVKIAGKWALADLIRDKNWKDAATLVKKMEFDSTDIAEAVGFSVLGSAELKSLRERVNQATLMTLEEVKKILPDDAYQKLLRTQVPTDKFV